jgi:YesN/AraC family two-component response regulator
MNGGQRHDVSVLYVEDDPDTREEILHFLARRTRVCFAAGDGAEGLSLFRERRPDLLVTDLQMPVMDGLKMLSAVRALDQELPVIVTTAHSDFAYLVELIELGVDHYVIKPVDFGKLQKTLDRCALLIRQRRELRRHQEERERMIAELQAALEKVRLLSGMLPICASCKKIRNDKGYWQQIESYISEHTNAEFTHGFCPVCAEKAMEEVRALGRERNRDDSKLP